MNVKRWFIPLIAMILALSMSVAVFAASDSDKKKVGRIHLKIEVDENDFDDDEIQEEDLDSIISIADDKGYYDIESEFVGASRWKLGKSAEVRVTAKIDDTDLYRFYNIKEDDIKIDGSKYIESKSISSRSKSKVVVRIKLKAFVGELDQPDGLYWSGRTAHWDSVTGANQYQVRLYKGSSQIATVATKKTNFDLYPGMKATGYYKFRVLAENTSAGKRGKWSETSDDIYISGNQIYSGSATLESDTGSGSGGSGSSSGTNSWSNGPSGGPNGSYVATSGWIQDGAGWRYLENGSSVMNDWRYVDNDWYYFGNTGYMMTGWLDYGGRRYYLNPISDGTKGAMKVGWFYELTTGSWYFFNTVSDGTRGAALTGVQMIDGRQYYFDPATGQLWMNRRVPDGRWAGTDGTL